MGRHALLRASGSKKMRRYVPPCLNGVAAYVTVFDMTDSESRCYQIKFDTFSHFHKVRECNVGTDGRVKYYRSIIRLIPACTRLGSSSSTVNILMVVLSTSCREGYRVGRQGSASPYFINSDLLLIDPVAVHHAYNS